MRCLVFFVALSMGGVNYCFADSIQIGGVKYNDVVIRKDANFYYVCSKDGDEITKCSKKRMDVKNLVIETRSNKIVDKIVVEQKKGDSNSIENVESILNDLHDKHADNTDKNKKYLELANKIEQDLKNINNKNNIEDDKIKKAPLSEKLPVLSKEIYDFSEKKIKLNELCREYYIPSKNIYQPFYISSTNTYQPFFGVYVSTREEAIDYLVNYYGQTEYWVRGNMGNTNNLYEIHRLLSESLRLGYSVAVKEMDDHTRQRYEQIGQMNDQEYEYNFVKSVHSLLNEHGKRFFDSYTYEEKKQMILERMTK